MKKISAFLKKLGPGLITGASDDDPSGIATYSQAGAHFGLAFLWTALITFPLMFAVQEMCARIGLVTSKGLIANIKNHYSRSLVIFTISLMVPTLVFNISANLASMAAVIHLLFPIIPIWAVSVFICLVIVHSIIFLSYKQIVSFLKYLCLSLLLYLVVPFLAKQNTIEILKSTFVPEIHFNKEFIGLLVAILGTTISPYLFFWQTTMSAEELRFKRKAVTENKFFDMKIDVGIGMLASNLVMYFIILTTGTILYKNGIHDILTVETAAKALEPIAGELSFLLFSLGIIGTGFLSIPVLCGCLSYTLCTAFDHKEGLNHSLKSAKMFYFFIILSILLSLLLNLIGVNPIKALIISAIANCLVSPPLLFTILLIANNSKIMGDKRNGTLSNFLGLLTLLLVTVSSLLYLYYFL
ncbi:MULTISPECIES: NRAMP family divalent metal transporter [Legionella]|uniref:Divalent metal cation transporter MntH n=1 Tax=Legionella drozanskii LLAP-1 TaxID=1212489 RepID=A0A0W0TEG0_9GAMM|nr:MULTISPECIES: divalent metal cation transporter [Legionella]KTC93853.1 Divalent metal cation transporter MntH [Legionella drozanskii LLAP-1]PJE10766.1 MAG: divalent metal cation transporter [Legionella sp.]